MQWKSFSHPCPAQWHPALHLICLFNDVPGTVLRAA